MICRSRAAVLTGLYPSNNGMQVRTSAVCVTRTAKKSSDIGYANNSISQHLNVLSMYISIIMVETQLNISVNIIDLQIAY